MAEQAAIGQDVIDFADALRLPRFARGRLRLGRPCRGHRRRAASRSRARDGADRRLHRAEHGQRRSRPPRPRTSTGSGISTTSTPNGAVPACRPTAARSAAICGRCGRRAGISATRPTTARRASFDNPDFVDVVDPLVSAPHRQRARRAALHGRSRRGWPRGRRSRRRRSRCTAPTTASRGRRSSRRPAERAVFEKLVARRVVPGVGHFMPRERPDAVSSALLELLATGA